MNPLDALAELGLPRDADGAAVRAAYLRLLRERRPETDPEGFMRLRAAYEVVRRRPVRAVVGTGGGTVGAEPKGPVSPQEPDEPPAEPDEPARVETAPPPDEPARVETAPPPDEPARVETAPPPDEPDDDDEPADDTGAPEPWLAAWDHAAATGREPPSPPYAALTRTLALYEAGDTVGARRLGRALDGWLRLRLNETRHFRDRGAVTLRNVRQLLRLPADYPLDELRILARAVRAGDPSQAARELRDPFEVRPSAQSSRARKLLVQHAPLLSGDVFGTAGPVETTSPAAWWLLFILVFAVLGNAATSCGDPSGSTTRRFIEVSTREPALIELKATRIDLCGEGEAASPLCTAAAEVTHAAARRDCPHAELALVAFDRALADAADPTFDARAAAFRAAVTKRCPPVIGGVEGGLGASTPPPPPVSPTQPTFWSN